MYNITTSTQRGHSAIYQSTTNRSLTTTTLISKDHDLTLHQTIYTTNTNRHITSHITSTPTQALPNPQHISHQRTTKQRPLSTSSQNQRPPIPQRVTQIIFHRCQRISQLTAIYRQQPTRPQRSPQSTNSRKRHYHTTNRVTQRQRQGHLTR